MESQTLKIKKKKLLITLLFEYEFDKIILPTFSNLLFVFVFLLLGF
jgi:hypothetical protein